MRVSAAPAIVSAALLALLVASTPARAEDPGPRELVLEGVAGVWLPEPAFRAMALDARRGRLLPELLELDEELVAGSRELLALVERRAAIAEAALVDARLATVSLESDLAEERRRSAHWSRSAALWLAVGFVLAVVAVTGFAALEAAL